MINIVPFIFYLCAYTWLVSTIRRRTREHIRIYVSTTIVGHLVSVHSLLSRVTEITAIVS